MEIMEDVVIVGAGIAGLATAVALKRVGVRALVLERSHQLRTFGAALTLLPNAWIALNALGVAHKLTSVYAPLNKGYVTNVTDGVTREIPFFGNDNKETGSRAVHRRFLLETLAEELPADSIRFSSRLTSIETYAHEGSSIAMLRMDDGTIIKAKILIGCDGVHSMVARWLGLTAPVHSGRSALRGLSVFPRGHGYSHEGQQYVDQNQRSGFIPVNDKEFYWFLTYKSGPKDEGMAEHPELIKQNVMERLAKDFPQKCLEIVENSDLNTLSWAPLMYRVPWNLVFGNLCKENITVAGDAMHPMTPDLGQGGCSALEDAVVLGRHIGNSYLQNGRIVSKEVAGILERYTKERRWRATTLITASYFSGQAQQSGSGWLLKFFRDSIFYKFLYTKILDLIFYDCGKLPTVSSSTYLGTQAKIE